MKREIPSKSETLMRPHSWEIREHGIHVENMHKEKRQKDFLIASILRIACAINERDPITAAELLDVLEDCENQIAKRTIDPIGNVIEDQNP